jgi:hypothetical protein
MYGEVVSFDWTNPVEADPDLDDADPQSVNSVALTPPVSPQNGDAYIVDAGATGDFAGHDGTIATYFDGAWTFTSQDDDTRVFNEADGKFYDVSGGTWTDAQVGLLTGDVTGYLPDLTVVGIQTRDVASTAPNQNDAYLWNQATSQWEPKQPIDKLARDMAQAALGMAEHARAIAGSVATGSTDQTARDTAGQALLIAETALGIAQQARALSHATVSAATDVLTVQGFM